MFCRNCGSQIPDNTKFCGKCGSPVAQPTGQRTGAAPPESHGVRSDLHLPALSPKVWAAAGGAALLILIAAVLCLGGKDEIPRADRKLTTDENAAAGKEDPIQMMYEEESLQNFGIENSYTIEDLYGTWTDEKQTLTLTFEQDGTLRVADANNLIGIDLLKYRESSDHTLSLSAEQSGLLGLISLSMEYELFGDILQVKISGQEFVLTRK